ncbi:MAG: hypothetical protein ABSH48_22660 [Verrucomicrobiota bacterium]
MTTVADQVDHRPGNPAMAGLVALEILVATVDRAARHLEISATADQAARATSILPSFSSA